MARLKGDQLVFWTLVANAIYWLAGAITPDPYASSAASLLLLLSSAGMFFRYAPHAFDVVINGRRDAGDGGQGSHIALYGATLLAAGSCYIGLFGFLWVLADQPTSWLGTPRSGYGRAVMSAGFAMMALSPDTTPTGIKLPNLLMIMLLLIAVAAGSFFAGRKDAPPEQAVYWRAIAGKLADRLCALLIGRYGDRGTRSLTRRGVCITRRCHLIAVLSQRMRQSRPASAWPIDGGKFLLHPVQRT